MTTTTTAKPKPRTRRTAKAAEPVLHAEYTTRNRVKIRPSVLPAALTGFVRDALVLANAERLRWNDTARFVGHVRLTLGSVLAYDRDRVAALWAAASPGDFNCGGKYGTSRLDYRTLGVETLRQFGGDIGSAAAMYDEHVVDAVKEMVSFAAAVTVAVTPPAGRQSKPLNGMTRSADWK